MRPILLIIALLFVQMGAFAHAAKHGTEKNLASHGQCEMCVTYAQVAGAAPLAEQARLPLCEARYQQPEAVIQAFPSRTVVHSRARAPPIHSV